MTVLTCRQCDYFGNRCGAIGQCKYKFASLKNVTSQTECWYDFQAPDQTEAMSSRSHEGKLPVLVDANK